MLSDTHGHAAGDAELLEVARLLHDATPHDAIIGRYGPDEFLVISECKSSDADMTTPLLEGPMELRCRPPE